jgi:hypothetical protein
LHVDAQGESDAGYTVNLKLYKEQELLLETDAKLSKRSPLVIKGPQVGSGQLLLVLVVEDDGNKQSQHHRRHSPNGSNPVVTAWRHLRQVIQDVLP